MSEYTFKSLCGKHTFSGCELTNNEEIEGDWGVENCGVCLFTLDDVTYKAIEDPDDGYRSYCKELMVTEQKPRYSFPGIDVVCHMMEDGRFGHNDVLVIRNAKNGKTILEVGTQNTDDYYPYCWFNYKPENIEGEVGER